MRQWRVAGASDGNYSGAAGCVGVVQGREELVAEAGLHEAEPRRGGVTEPVARLGSGEGRAQSVGERSERCECGSDPVVLC